MAKPIKETPILSGKDAKRFSNEIEKGRTQIISKEVRERIRANYKILSEIANF